jgi:MerR family transcriptional regulator, light-induced transcriptional regulator
MTDTAENENLIPIRTLSELTGVNSVTIRAWERRYGLLKPTRTRKGHRLYNESDVETIKKVQRHLEQGIAISKIKNIIHQSTSLPIDENWEIHGKKLIAEINVLNIDKFESYLYELSRNYTPRVLWEYLIQPLENELANSKQEYGMQSKLLFLLNGVQKQASHFIKSQAHDARESVLIIGLDEDRVSLESYFIAMEMTGNGLKPILDFYLASPGELPFIVENIKPAAILFHSNGALTKQFVTREINGRMKKSGLPIFVTGNAAIVNESLLEEQHIDHFSDHQELITALVSRVSGHE